MPFRVVVDDLSGREVRDLIRTHLAGMHAASPPESVHALGVEALRAPDVTFWSVWLDDDLLGCGALKQIDAAHGEVKSMRTAAQHLRKGVAAHLLAHIVDEARRRSYRRLSLETGSTADFAPAHRLYERLGFARCGPFADYANDPFSVFMTRTL